MRKVEYYNPLWSSSASKAGLITLLGFYVKWRRWMNRIEIDWGRNA